MSIELAPSECSMAIGDIIKWRTVNGYAVGEIISRQEKGYLTRLPGNKFVIVDVNSRIEKIKL